MAEVATSPATALGAGSGSSSAPSGRGTFGPTTVLVPQARIQEADGQRREWRNRTRPADKRRTKRAAARIAGVSLAGANTRRVRRAWQGLCAGAVGKDTVIRAWHRVQSAWQAWQKRNLAGDAIVFVGSSTAPW